MIYQEDSQRIMQDLFDSFPAEIEKSYSFLSETVRKLQTFDLLANISYYNNAHDSETYTDFRGDRNFFVSEVLTLLCLKNEFVEESTVSFEEFFNLVQEIQKATITYCGRKDALEITANLKSNSLFSDITGAMSREAKQIRNPGLPDHHLIFSEKLFEPIKQEIKSLMGFSISDSIKIRKSIPELINIKCRNGFEEAKLEANKLAKEITKYRKKKLVEPDSSFTQEQLEEYSLLTDKEIRHGLQNHTYLELFFNFSKVYTFTAQELSDFSKIELHAGKAFLKTFSCSFPSLKSDEEIYKPITILKSKPILEHNGQFLLPSFPLLTWAVEEVVEAKIKESQKRYTRFAAIKHDFMLNEGLDYFERLLPTAQIIESNLYYTIHNDEHETDGLIVYDRTLFIIEAKGQRITAKARSGHILKMEDHLKDLVKDSYTQGIRTLRYIEENEIAEFRVQDGEKIKLCRTDFDDIIIVSMTLEPVGNLAMLIKATNDIGYFNPEHFPWIISIYDLVVLADLIDNPILFIQYIKRRNDFLTHGHLSIYEELDLVSYFMYNSLHIKQTLKDAEENSANAIHFAPDTDAINDYYMYKFGHKTKVTKKPKHYISKEFNHFLLQLDYSEVHNRVKIGLILLELNNTTIKQLLEKVKITKAAFVKNKGLHDCSIFSHSLGGVGVTYMTGSKPVLSDTLQKYCSYKVKQLNASIWIGLGDSSTDRKEYSFTQVFIYEKEK
ncbi:hypothetical protein [Pontibacter sp. H249]|uniref:hypothetical protein n=1 Tax=Pontibacter sp. H249 TaxID=3133420 RepID=UPI0030BE8342